MRTLLKSVVLVLWMAGCSEGGFGDEPPPVKGSVLGNGIPFTQLNNTPAPRVESIPSVSVTGVQVVFVDRFDETGSGATGNIFLQDFTRPAGPYQGMLAFQPSFTPPSFRASVGDVVDVTGQFIEFQPNLDFLKQTRPGWTTPEINANLRLRFDAPYIQVEPIEINILDFLEYEKGRPWLSMLVVARNIKLISDVTVDNAGRASARMDVGDGVSVTLVPTITNSLFDLKKFADDIKAERGINSLEGAEIESVTGIVTLFDRFQIAPRSAADIKLK
ncbi:MAG: hypothetical protein MUF64_11015 [Polyangiaceae bacterium]|nr:hypothetical protein [Polyangiaceae bacterium]